MMEAAQNAQQRQKAFAIPRTGSDRQQTPEPEWGRSFDEEHYNQSMVCVK